MELTIENLQSELRKWDGCDLAKQSKPVLGEGNPHAELMFIGEAPGQKEDEQGRPFVGPAGKLLNELLESIGLQREDVYMSNVVKYRPPENRDPTDEEKTQCLPWIKMEIAIVKPKVIVPLGRHALGHFFPKLSITNAHGKSLRVNNEISIFPLYHPAAALHNGNLRQPLFDDIAALKIFLDSLLSPNPNPHPNPQ